MDQSQSTGTYVPSYQTHFLRMMGITCYSRFTSISKAAPSAPSSEQPKHNVLLRSQTKQHPTTSTGILSQICIFCSKSRKKNKDRELSLASCEYDSPEANVKEAAQILNDTPLLTKTGSIGFHSKEVKYHHECKREYLNHYSGVYTVKLKIQDCCILPQTTECKTEEILRHFPVSFVLKIF